MNLSIENNRKTKQNKSLMFVNFLQEKQRQRRQAMVLGMILQPLKE